MRDITSLRPFQLILPATSANLGPAFDSAALALKLHLKVNARPADAFTIHARGRDQNICSSLERNLVLETYQDVLRQHGKEPIPLHLDIQNDIPIGKGCGSSAAARLMGVALAVHFGKLSWSSNRILEEAARREGHADNAAACWLGGFAIAQWLKNGHSPATTAEALHAYTVPQKKAWPVLVVAPPEPLSTEKARQVLPANYSRAQAVANIQSAMSLVLALSQGRPELFALAFRDQLHEPYREQLCPLLPLLRPLAGQKGILGVALSGAGPSVLVVLEPGSSMAKIGNRITTRLREAGREAELIFTAVETRGGSHFFPNLQTKAAKTKAARNKAAQTKTTRRRRV